MAAPCPLPANAPQRAAPLAALRTADGVGGHGPARTRLRDRARGTAARPLAPLGMGRPSTGPKRGNPMTERPRTDDETSASAQHRPASADKNPAREAESQA